MMQRRCTLRRLNFEALENRRLLVAATFGELSSSLGLGGLQGGSGEFHAGGLTFTDLNSDGFADLYLIGPAQRGNRLYINVEDGNGGRRFQRAAGDGGTNYTAGNSTGAVAADYDNDGDLDIYLTNFRSDNILFKNLWMEDHPNGLGDPLSLRFQDVTATTDPTPTNPAADVQHGLKHATYQNPNPLFGNDILDNTLAAAWADVNRDGWIDLYVGSWDGTNGDPQTAEDGQLGERDTLYLNNGDGTFSDITMAWPSTATRLLDDGGFEMAAPSSNMSRSDWVMVAPDNSAQFQAAGWAASEGNTGVWLKGFEGSPANPADARLTQVVTAPASGDYVLSFDAKVEANFPSVIGGFQVSLSSDGTGGSVTFDILSAAANDNFNRYRLELAGVSAGDQLTIAAEMISATGGSGSALSGMVDAFLLTPPATTSQPSVMGGWEYFDGSLDDSSLPAEFSGHNALQFADFNNDGWQDLIVATMGGGGVGPNKDMLYLNLGQDLGGNWLGFKMVSYEIGFGGSESSDMGVAVADLENDGDLDYFSTLLPDAHPLWINQLNDSDGLSFTQTAINNTFSWGANFHDFDNNGRVDLMVGTEIDRRSYLHLQDWNGSLVEHGGQAGLTSRYSTRGVAVADYDRDGWSEAALWAWNGNNPGIQFYQNNSQSQNSAFHFLTLELFGDPNLPGRFRSCDAIGARAYVTADFDGSGQIDADETRMEEVLSGHSNASTTSSLALEFGLGLATTADVRIVWGSGRETLLTDVTADAFVEVREKITSGDFNVDGTYDCQDVDALVAAIADGDSQPLLDLTGDAVVDGADLDAWLAEVGAANLGSGNPYQRGDANLDGSVDVADFNIWNRHKFTNVAAWCAGDFNADGSVDVADFNFWNARKFTFAARMNSPSSEGYPQRNVRTVWTPPDSEQAATIEAVYRASSLRPPAISGGTPDRPFSLRPESDNHSGGNHSSDNIENAVFGINKDLLAELDEIARLLGE